MNNDSKAFLADLLSTPSPSGREMEIQRKWMKYVSTYAHKMETDMAGNAIAILNPEAPFKVLIAGHCDEIGFIVNRIDDNGFIYVDKVGGISAKPAVGMKVQILGSGGNIIGVIGANAEHHGGVKDGLEMGDIY